MSQLRDGSRPGQLKQGDRVEYSYWTAGVDGRGEVLGWNPDEVVIGDRDNNRTIGVPWDGVRLISREGITAMKIDDLTSTQRRLATRVDTEAGDLDLRDVLISIEADAKDKAKVAEFYGGPGAGAEFREGHTSKRSRCRHCANDIKYLDGIRDPYWVHDDHIGRGHPPLTRIEPNDAHTRLVYEKHGRVYRPYVSR